MRVERGNTVESGSLHYVLVRAEKDGGGQGEKAAVTREDGTASLKNMPPGRYRAYAFTSIDINAVSVPEILRTLEEYSTVVEVNAKMSSSGTVRAVPPDRAALAFQSSTKIR